MKHVKSLLFVALATVSVGTSVFAADTGWERATEGTSGRSRLSYGTVTVSTNAKSGSAYTKTETNSGKATKVTAKVSTYYTGGVGPSSTNSATNVASVTSNSVTCSTTKGRRAEGYGTITYAGETQSASPSKSY